MGTEATIARNTFEGILKMLSRTKEIIGKASRHAIDCAKYSLVVEVSLISVIFQYLNKQLILFYFIVVFYFWKLNDENFQGLE